MFPIRTPTRWFKSAISALWITNSGGTDTAPTGSGVHLGLAIGHKDEVYVCDSENDRVAVFDRYGSFEKSLAEGSLSEPAGVCTGPEDVLFVADTGHNRVVVLDLRTGDVAALIGGPDAGQRPGAFKAPKDVVFGPGNILYVLDGGNHRIQKFDMMISRR